MVTPGFVISSSHDPTLDADVDGGASLVSRAWTLTGVMTAGGVVAVYSACSSMTRLYALSVPLPDPPFAARPGCANSANASTAVNPSSLRITFIVSSFGTQ